MTLAAVTVVSTSQSYGILQKHHWQRYSCYYKKGHWEWKKKLFIRGSDNKNVFTQIDV